METAVHEKLELYICCRNLKDMDVFSKSDPQVRLYVKDNNEWNLLGQTEVIQDNLNPVFDTTFILHYLSGTKRELLFEVVDIDSPTTFELIGTAETSVAEIFGTKKHLLTLDLKDKKFKTTGELVVRAEKIRDACHIAYLQFKAEGLINTDGIFGKSDPFLKIYKIRHGADQLLVYEGEPVMNNLNPEFAPMKIRDYKLCEDDDYETPFKIEVWDFEEDGGHHYIGGCETTLNQLKSGKNQLTLHSFKGKVETGLLKVVSFSLEERPSFHNYIKHCEQLENILAIDFSKANSISKNLHAKLSDGKMNEYEVALKAISQIILREREDDKVSVFGFGGTLEYASLISKETSHCFPCNGTAPEVIGTNGILEAYLCGIECVKQGSPTYFAPLITEVMKICDKYKQGGNNEYVVLVILTAGEINDFDATMDALRLAAYMPLSIIIVGIGNGNFSKMEAIDNDKGLPDKKGRKMIRDLVQFVPFKGFGGDIDYLSERVLAEVPDQIVDYMKLMEKDMKTSFSPRKKKENSLAPIQVNGDAGDKQNIDKHDREV